MELRYRSCQLRGAIDEAGQRFRLEGIAVRYGDTATLEWGETERILAGCFGNSVNEQDVLLRFQHNRSMPLARTGGGGLTLRDTPTALLASAVLPQTATAHEALGLVNANVLRGVSVGFVPIETRRAADGATEIVRARLTEIGLVDKPAYPDSVVAAKRAAFEARGIAASGRREVRPGPEVGAMWFL